MNYEHARPDADLSAIERSVMGRQPTDDGGRESGRDARLKKASEGLEKELSGLLGDLGIGGGDSASVPSVRETESVGRPKKRLDSRGGAPRAGGMSSRRSRGSRGSGSSRSSGSSYSGSSESESGSESSGGSYSSGGSGSSYSSGGSSGSSRSSGTRASKVINGLRKELDLGGSRRRRERLYEARGHDREDRHFTTRRDQISDVMKSLSLGGTTGGGEASAALRAEEERETRLEEIASLVQVLEGDQVDMSNITIPDSSSSDEDIKIALRTLRMKNNRNRFTSLGEEAMMGVAEIIEDTFDGTTEIPVLGWKPDYTGYRNTVQAKMMRMRFETSQLVRGIIEGYNVGPVGRMLLELLPSLVLYPSQNRRVASAPGLYDQWHGGGGGGDDRMRSSIGALRAAEPVADLAAAANL
jgi:hypothetical protein